jgi:hypothetical protein
MHYIIYKGNYYSKLTVHFSHLLHGSDFFKILELAEFPIKQSGNILLKYAITELVTNSIRALNEKKIEKEVVVEFAIAGNFIKIIVTDCAGGFDLGTLPISINENNSKIDILSAEFQDYRERHEFNRFGIGLVSAKLALDAFHLVFIDENGNETPWQGAGSVRGTRIVAAKRISPEVRPWAEGTFVRRNERHSIFTKVTINDSIEAYLIDISTQGLRLLIFNKNIFHKDEKIRIKIENIAGLNGGMIFTAVIRWIVREGVFWQIGSEFAHDESFSAQTITGLVEKVESNPHILPGLVVIEGV